MKCVLTSCGLLMFAAAAAAQPVPPGGGAASRPAFSPYLNLLNGNGSPGINYLGIIRPQQRLQQEINQNAQQSRQANGTLQQELNGLAVGADPNLPFTGRVARFNSLAPYYTRNPITGVGGTLRSGAAGAGGGFNSLGGSFAGLGGAGGVRAPVGGAGANSGARGGMTAPRGGAGGVRR